MLKVKATSIEKKDCINQKVNRIKKHLQFNVSA